MEIIKNKQTKLPPYQKGGMQLSRLLQTIAKVSTPSVAVIQMQTVGIVTVSKWISETLQLSTCVLEVEQLLDRKSPAEVNTCPYNSAVQLKPTALQLKTIHHNLLPRWHPHLGKHH